MMHREPIQPPGLRGRSAAAMVVVWWALVWVASCAPSRGEAGDRSTETTPGSGVAVHADSLSWVEVQKVAALGGQPVSAWRGDGMKGETSLTDRMTQLESPLLVLAPEAKQDAALGVRFDSSDPIMMVPLVGEGEGDHSLQLGRIDVVHVVVTNSDDSETTVEGGYAVLEAQSGTKLLPRGAAWIPTGFGVDVFPGDYIVRVSYEHPADGARMTEDYPVSFSQ